MFTCIVLFIHTHIYIHIFCKYLITVLNIKNGINYFYQWKWKSLSHVQLSVTPWTIQSVEFSRPEYWSGQPFPSPRDLPSPGIEPKSPALQVDSLSAELSGKPICFLSSVHFNWSIFISHLILASIVQEIKTRK